MLEMEVMEVLVHVAQAPVLLTGSVCDVRFVKNVTKVEWRELKQSV